MTIHLAVLGATGKMGKQVIQLAHEDPQFKVTGGHARNCSVQALGELMEALSACDVAIDFTSHLATKSNLEAALSTNKPLVIGTTGHSREERKEIEEAARHIPILFSPNFSFGIALCLEAVAQFGKALLGTATIQITETHHVHKKDTPSGTALALAAAIAGGQNNPAIVIHSIRSEEVTGEHTVIFEWGSERIELKHTASSRDAFAQGALMAAKFLVNQPPGLYSLKDVHSAHNFCSNCES